MAVVFNTGDMCRDSYQGCVDEFGVQTHGANYCRKRLYMKGRDSGSGPENYVTEAE